MATIIYPQYSETSQIPLLQTCIRTQRQSYTVHHFTLYFILLVLNRKRVIPFGTIKQVYLYCGKHVVKICIFAVSSKQNQHCICQSAKYLHFPKMSCGLVTGRGGGVKFPLQLSMIVSCDNWENRKFLWRDMSVNSDTL